MVVRNVERMVVGGLIAGLGIILLVGRFGDALSVARLWPLFLIAVGVSRLFAPASTVVVDGASASGPPFVYRREIGFHPRRGAWLIVIGVWLLLDQLRIARASATWPMLLIATGLWLVWCALRDRNEAK